MSFDLYYSNNKQDYILYVAANLIGNAKAPIKKTEGIKAIGRLLSLINDQTLVSIYTDQIAITLKIGKKDIKFAIQEHLLKEKQKRRKEQKKEVTDQRDKSIELEEFDSPIEPNSISEWDDNYEYGFFKRDGCYWASRQLGNVQKDIRISNFVMRFLYFIPDDSDNAKRIVKLQNKFGEIQITEITAKQFAVASFKAVLRSRKGGCSYTGEQREIDMLVEFEQEHHEKIAKEITTLGFQPGGDFFALANKIITTDNELQEYNKLGFVINADKFFYNPVASYYNEENKNYLDLQKYTYREMDVPVKMVEWSSLMEKAYGPKAYIGIAFLIASMFRDHIFKVNGQLLMLFLRGKPGAGKTKFADSFINLIGIPRDEISLTGLSSPKGLYASLSQIRNFIITLDEYKNNLSMDFIEVLKNIYDGFAKKLKAYDQQAHTTITHPVESSVIVTGQDLPTKDIALFQRTFLLDFFKGNREEDQINAFLKLKECEEHGLTNIIRKIIKHRDHFVNNYKGTYREIFFRLKKENLKHVNIDDRLIQNSSQLLASFKLLSDKEDFAFSFKELEGVVLETIIAQNELIKNTDENAKFWKIFINLCNDEIKKEIPEKDSMGEVISTKEITIRESTIIYNKHYKRFIYNDTDVIGIKFSDVWALYMKEHQKLYHIPGLGEDNLKGYLVASSAFVHYDNDGVKENTKNERMKLYGKGYATRLHMFDWKMLNNDYFFEYETDSQDNNSDNKENNPEDNLPF